MSDKPIGRDSFVLKLREPFQVRAEDAFVDRIELTIGDWGLFGSDDEVLSQLNDLQNSEVYDANGEILSLFNNFELKDLWGQFDIWFATSKNDDRNSERSPLVAGRLERVPRFRPNQSLKDARVQVCFAATLNLTRWVQAQALKRFSSIRRPKLRSEYVMAIVPERMWYRDERPLMPSTNIIIGPVTRYSYAKSRAVEHHLASYLRATSRLLARTMSQLPFDGHDAVVRERYYSIREIEFYWEFDHKSPIQYVWQVMLRALALGARASLGSELIATRLDHQSPSIKVELAKGIFLRVYAKTDRRVRFEILLESSGIEGKVGARGGDSLRSIVSKIEPLRELATQHINDVLPIINDGTPPPSSATGLLLMAEVQRACPDHFMAEAIIASLVAFDRVVPYNNDPLRSVVHSLRDAGVLRTVKPRSRSYVVTDEYREPLNSLRSLLTPATST